MNHRIFERKWRSWANLRACLFDRPQIFHSPDNNLKKSWRRMGFSSSSCLFTYIRLDHPKKSIDIFHLSLGSFFHAHLFLFICAELNDTGFVRYTDEPVITLFFLTISKRNERRWNFFPALLLFFSYSFPFIFLFELQNEKSGGHGKHHCFLVLFPILLCLFGCSEIFRHEKKKKKRS